MFVVLYALLLVLFLYLLNAKIQKGPEPLEDVETGDRRSRCRTRSARSSAGAMRAGASVDGRRAEVDACWPTSGSCCSS